MDKKKKPSPLKKSKLTASAILAKGRNNAREILNTLSGAQLVHVFITSSPKDRLKILPLLNNPVDVVRRIPEEEIYWTIKEVGIKDSLPVLKLTSADQLHFLCDVEWWDGDTLSLKRIYKWLKAISKCGDSKVKQWLKSFDFELLVLTFKKFIRVYKPGEMTNDYGESIDTLPLFTLDGIYFVQFLNNDCSQLLGKILTILISIDTQLFSNIMEMVIWGLDSEMEYESFEKTQMRLEEKGLPEYDEAKQVYRFIKDIESIPEKEYETRPEKKTFQKSFYPMRLGTSKKLFLTRVLDRTEDYNMLEEISIALAHTANKVLIADNIAVNSHGSFKTKLMKTTGYINIGLEVLSGQNEIRAEHELQIRWLEHIFQVGWSKVIGFKHKYQPVIKSMKEKNVIDYLDFPYGEFIKGIGQEHPLFFNGKTKDEYNLYRNFQSLDDLIFVEKIIENALFLTDLIFNRLNLKPKEIDSGAPVYYQDAQPTLHSLFMTGLANKIVNDQWVYQALGLEETQQFCVWIFNNQDQFTDQRASEVCSQIYEILESSIETVFTSNEKSCLSEFILSCLENMKLEYKEATEEGFFDLILFKTIYVQHY